MCIIQPFPSPMHTHTHTRTQIPRAYNKTEILAMENEIVSTLCWNVTVPTAHSFLCRSVGRYVLLCFAPKYVQKVEYMAPKPMQKVE